MQETASSIPGLGGSLGEGNGNPLQYSCLEEISWTEKPGGLQSMGSQKSRTWLSGWTTARVGRALKSASNPRWRPVCHALSFWGLHWRGYQDSVRDFVRPEGSWARTVNSGQKHVWVIESKGGQGMPSAGATQHPHPQVSTHRWMSLGQLNSSSRLSILCFRKSEILVASPSGYLRGLNDTVWMKVLSMVPGPRSLLHKG